MTEHTRKDFYKFWSEIALRYSDSDMLGHVNNAVFATLLESGRVELLHRDGRWLDPPGTLFVIKSLSINFRAEMHFPGVIEVGTGLQKFGTTSVSFVQALFQGDACCATSDSTIVLIDEDTRRPTPLSDDLKNAITAALATSGRTRR